MQKSFSMRLSISKQLYKNAFFKFDIIDKFFFSLLKTLFEFNDK